MNTHDKYELPTLPEPFIYTRPGKTDGALFHAGHMQDYARTAIEPYQRRIAELESQLEAIGAGGVTQGQRLTEADRQRQGEVVVTKTPEGEIIAVTRQDDEGKILSVIAEADRERRVESQQPFGWTDCAATDEGAVALYERPQAQGEPVLDRADLAFILDELREAGLYRAANLVADALQAPQPAEPSGASTLHNADSGAQNGIQATQPANPTIKEPLTVAESMFDARTAAKREA